MEMFHHTYSGNPQVELTAEERQLQKELRGHVICLADEIGERNQHRSTAMLRALAYIQETWVKAGFEVNSQDYWVGAEMFSNIWVEIPGAERPDEIVVLGAHYDTFPGTPGADDNATAVAGLLSLSARGAATRPKRTLRCVAFANEEPPFFMTENMGSYVFARRCREAGDRIQGMVCLEMLGYYSDEPGSQQETYGMMPDVGNFIVLCGNPDSKKLIERSARAFTDKVDFPLQAAALPESMVPMVAFSDHWSFWQFDWPAYMVTDTGPLRNPHYHLPTDTVETLDFARFTRVVRGVDGILEALLN